MLSMQLHLHFLLKRECFDKIINVMKYIKFLIIFLSDIFVLNVIKNLLSFLNSESITELSCPGV